EDPLAPRVGLGHGEEETGRVVVGDAPEGLVGEDIGDRRSPVDDRSGPVPAPRLPPPEAIPEPHGRPLPIPGGGAAVACEDRPDGSPVAGAAARLHLPLY